jgi:hypothetical protein
MIGRVPERNLPATDRAVEFSGNPTFHYLENNVIAIAVGQERITYETHEQSGFPSWWFLLREQPGRQGLAVSQKTKHLHARCACRHAFLHSRRSGVAHHSGETPTISSYRDSGRK